MLFVDHVYIKQFYGYTNAYDPIEYTLTMNLLVYLYQTQRHSSGTLRSLRVNC